MTYRANAPARGYGRYSHVNRADMVWPIALAAWLGRWTTAAIFVLLAVLVMQEPGQAVPGVIDRAAFRGLGALAFMSGEALYVLNGRDGSLRRLVRPGPVTGLEWSPNGQWLAYKRYRDSIGKEPATRSTAVWVVRADGTNAHRALSRSVESFGWTPVGPPRLALNVVGQDNANGLWVTAPAGPPHKILSADDVRSFAWRADGRFLAYVASMPSLPDRGDALFIVPADGGRSVREFVEEHGDLAVADWWADGKGILFWSDSIHSASVASYGLPLQSLRLADKHLDTLVESAHVGRLSLTWSPDRHLVLVEAGHSSRANYDRRLELCDVARRVCGTVAQPAGTVSFRPAWSPDGQKIAFVSARADGPFATPQDVEAWAQTTNLVIERIKGADRPDLVIPLPNVSSPLWSRDGRHILYVTHGGAWLLDVYTKAVHQVIIGSIDDIAWYR